MAAGREFHQEVVEEWKNQGETGWWNYLYNMKSNYYVAQI